MGRCSAVLYVVAAIATTVSGQASVRQQVLSTFIYTHYGDRTPYVLSDPTLTPLGAKQLYNAGAAFRGRYVSPASDSPNDEFTTIRNISPYQLFQDEITILATNEHYISASAQAFMQGLYPPLAASSNYTYIEGLSELADGTNVLAPLDGYQYPNLQVVTGNDLDSIWTQGWGHCPAHTVAAAQYYQSPGFQGLQASTDAFYDSLQPEFLNGIFTNSSVGYFDAYFIWDYLNYEYIHNTTVAQNLDAEEVARIKILAADWVFAMYGNTSLSGNTEGDHIGLIAGRTLASRIVQAIYTTINTQGRKDKMTLLFGSFEPMISFAALTGLVSEQNSAFYNLPQPGSSFVFELFALRENDIGTYPDLDEIYVRFLYQNSTDETADLVEYPLFGRSPSVSVMTLEDFILGMERIMIHNVEDWCTTCSSYSIFCPAFTDDGTGLAGSSTQHKGLSAVVAGVIGAVVALVVFGLIIATLMLIGGCRIQRVNKKRRSDLGGFKGAEKLASDQDLTIPKGGMGAVVKEPGTAHVRGHERVGSWELRDAKAEEAYQGTNGGSLIARMRRPSFEDDEMNVNPYGAGVKPHDHV
jgi:Histidine phosphatase superfamily (branch 2)